MGPKRVIAKRVHKRANESHSGVLVCDGSLNRLILPINASPAFFLLPWQRWSSWGVVMMLLMMKSPRWGKRHDWNPQHKRWGGGHFSKLATHSSTHSGFTYTRTGLSFRFKVPYWVSLHIARYFFSQDEDEDEIGWVEGKNNIGGWFHRGY